MFGLRTVTSDSDVEEGTSTTTALHPWGFRVLASALADPISHPSALQAPLPLHC